MNLIPLYNVPRETTIRIGDEEFFFDHIDGAYSYYLDSNKQVIHLASWTPVEVVTNEQK
jgi:hypothetical protein